MKRLLISLMFMGLASCTEPQTPVAKIASGDFILVKGKVMHCDDWGEFMIAYDKVADRDVRILDFKLNAVGLTPVELEASLKEAIFEDTGHRPFLSIEIFSEGKFDLNRDEIEEGINMYYEAIRACDQKVEDFKKRSKDVAMGTAMYNKAVKFVPGLQPSTGRRNATHSYAA